MLNDPMKRVRGCIKRYQGEAKPKVKHATYEEAVLHMNDQVARANHVHQYAVYKCGHCGFYHIGREQGDRKYKKQRNRRTHDEILVGKLIGALKAIIDPGRARNGNYPPDIR